MTFGGSFSKLELTTPFFFNGNGKSTLFLKRSEIPSSNGVQEEEIFKPNFTTSYQRNKHIK